MKKVTVLFAILALNLLSSCAAFKPQTTSKTNTVSKTPPILEAESKKREREEALQDQKDRERVLRRKAQFASASAPVKTYPQNKRIEMLNPTASRAQSPKELYAELIQCYDRNDEISFSSRFQAFQDQFPKSPLADDVLYLAGLMSLSNKNYGPALKNFNQVIEKYPMSNKVASSLFAKGVALKKMNLADEARQVFSQVKKIYPGSPEAMRAGNELKIMARH